MNMIDGWPAPWWCVTLIVFLAVSGFMAWCWAATRALEWLWQSRYARLADPEPYPDEPMAYPVDPPPGYHFEVHDENWLEELPAERTGEQLGFTKDEPALCWNCGSPGHDQAHCHHPSDYGHGGPVAPCPICKEEREAYYGSHDRREPLDLAEDTRTWAWGPGGPASLPVFSPAITAAIDQLHEAGERHYLAEAPIPDFINEDLAAAGFKTYATNAAALDSIVMRAIQ